jgi:uncharacterized protein YndB with AHSA1/START domain
MTNSSLGEITGPASIRFVRRLPGPIERVWSYLADSELRGQWLAPGPLGDGKLDLTFRHADLSPHQEAPPAGFSGGSHLLSCKVLEMAPPHRLVFTWGEDVGSVVTFELTPHEGDVLLTVSQTGLKRGDMLSVATGWHTHLAMLVARAEGRTPPAFWTIWKTLDGVYGPMVEA